MLEFTALTTDNYDCHERLIMASEELFPEDIRETSATYLEALGRDGVLAYIASCNGDYAGNVVGFPLCEKQRRLLRFQEMETCHNGLIYLFNIVAMPQFQGRGIGKRLLCHFLEMAYQSGFSKVGGHFRGNGSLSNFTKLGGEAIATFTNWFDTGEDYTYCELNLCTAMEQV